MLRLSIPAELVERIHEECARAALDQTERDALFRATPAVIEANETYVRAMRTGDVSTVLPHSLTDPEKRYFLNNYSVRMVPRTSPGRRYYDEIRLSSPDNVCPLCLHGDVTALDHYLPKSTFPLLATSAQNLVPICHDCNKVKRDLIALSARETPMHPYFDDLGLGAWLNGVWNVQSSVVDFSIAPPADWGDGLRARMSYHFQSLRLGERFRVWAGREVPVVRSQIRTLSATDSVDFMKSHAASLEDALGINHWRSAAMRALVNARELGVF